MVQNGLRHASHLFIVAIFAELTDLIFAVDSISTVFAAATIPFVVLTSDNFASLCLRSMYFQLEELAGSFNLLK